LLLSQGVPMIAGGDEIGRTQLGNNNGYCQDNEVSWFHWDLSPAQRNLLAFARYLIHLRRDQPVLRRRKFFQGQNIRGAEVKDIAWFKPNGKVMDDEDWNTSYARSLGVLLDGSETDEADERGIPLIADTFFLMFNAHHKTIRFVLPGLSPTERWERLLDTAETEWGRHVVLKPQSYRLRGRSVAVFRLMKPEMKA